MTSYSQTCTEGLALIGRMNIGSPINYGNITSIESTSLNSVMLNLRGLAPSALLSFIYDSTSGKYIAIIRSDKSVDL